MRRTYWLIADLVVVLAFVVLGRASHGEAITVVGVLSTGWPFAAGLALGWLLSALGRRVSDRAEWHPAGIRAGALTLVLTVAGGMTLRIAAGGSAPLAFIAVAVGFLGLLLLGWRALRLLVLRARRRAGMTDRPVAG